VASSSLTGTKIFANGVAHLEPENGRSEANWNAGIEELVSLNLIRDEVSEREIFSLTKSGYAYADNLWLLLILRCVEKTQSHEHDYVGLDKVALIQTIGQTLAPMILQEETKGEETKGHAEQLTGSEDLVSFVGC